MEVQVTWSIFIFLMLISLEDTCLGLVFTLYVFFMQIFRKEPFFYGHDNHDQLVKIAKVILIP